MTLNRGNANLVKEGEAISVTQGNSLKSSKLRSNMDGMMVNSLGSTPYLGSN